MRFYGRIYKDGKFWLAEVPSFDAMTQGRTRNDALSMLADWFTSMVGRKGFRVEVRPLQGGDVEICSDDVRTIVALLLQRQRHRSGLSLAQVAERLGARSRNSYARYENGSVAPTVEKLAELLRAVAPDCDIVIERRRAA